MDVVFIYTALVLSGLIFGSYAGATVWRLRARQLVEDEKMGESVDQQELAQLRGLTMTSTTKDRSRCLHCGHALRWYDLLPLASWLSLGGKCRYCRVSIGRFEPLIELAVMAFFVVSYMLWPYDLNGPLAVTQFIAWLLAGVGLAILFVYDLKWFLLPNSVMFTVIGIAGVSAAITVVQSDNILTAVINVAGAIGILSGLYLMIYFLSRGNWVGFGDIKLGLALALLLADWKLAFLTLFAANLIGCAIVIPAMAMGKLNRQSPVPFGPLLITGFLITMFFGQSLIDWYLSWVF